ncbi:MAG: L-histidine N(alpha)-methyltransferase [Bacteroidota bacterium]
MTNQFAHDVLNGLNSTPKTLPSKYFYDKTGDNLFQQIMKLDEYYLTRSEYQVLDKYKKELLGLFSKDAEKFNLVEFGAGDGYKTKVLLESFLKANASFDYVPIDISANVLNQLETSLKNELPELHVKSIQDDYFSALKKLENGGTKDIILFLGSNIGNFTQERADSFLKALYDGMNEGDMVLIGFDLKKKPRVILDAYNDSKKVTAAFNFNLLNRINNELDGNFDLEKFEHFPIYNPMTGTTSSFLVSKEDQTVEIMDSAIQFDAWEAIHMEISQKYDLKMVNALAETAGFELIENFYDDNKYYLNSLWQK